MTSLRTPFVRELATVTLALGLLLGATLACKGSSSAPSGPVEPGSNLSTTRKDYVGDWEGGGVTLHIGAGGDVVYEKKNGNTSNKITGTLDHFEGDDIAVKVLVTTINIKVDSPPKSSGGTWTMKVEGADVTRQ